jgi:hypothetical protein
MNKLQKIIFLSLFFPLSAFAFCTDFTGGPTSTIGCLYTDVVELSGISALLMIIIGGFFWLTSAGDVGKIGTAKDMIFSAIIGLLIVLASYLILTVIGLNPNP